MRKGSMIFVLLAPKLRLLLSSVFFFFFFFFDKLSIGKKYGIAICKVERLNVKQRRS